MTTETLEAEAPGAQSVVKGGVAPYLTVDGAAKASAFYQRAFAAEEVSRMGSPDWAFNTPKR